MTSKMGIIRFSIISKNGMNMYDIKNNDILCRCLEEWSSACPRDLLVRS